MGKENLKNTAVTIKSYRYCRILIAVFFFAFALRPLPYFQAQKKPAFCRRLPSPRYIWTFPLCTPFPILYQSQASLLSKKPDFNPIHRKRKINWCIEKALDVCYSFSYIQGFRLYYLFTSLRLLVPKVNTNPNWILF